MAVVHSDQTPLSVAQSTPLPLRGDSEDVVLSGQQKDINKTTGGKITNGFINYVVGFVMNSGLSIGMTYFVNPHPLIKDAKNSLAGAVAGVFKTDNPLTKAKYVDGARSSIEILCMFLAGTIATSIMTPMVINREKIAFRVNKLLGKDTDVLPVDMRPHKEPVTLEEKIEQEVSRRVAHHHSGMDLWKARLSSMLIVLFGDALVNANNRSLEDKGRQSLDTYALRAGQKLNNVFKEKSVTRMRNWFGTHGAGLDDMQKNMKEHYDRLKATELKFGNSRDGVLNENSMVVSEQFRMLGKELGWTAVLATFVDKLTSKFSTSRIKNEHVKVLADLKKEGIIPDGYDVAIATDGNVTIHAPHALVAGSSENGLEVSGTHALAKYSRQVQPRGEYRTAAENSRSAAAQASIA